jgi:hypothetical protein
MNIEIIGVSLELTNEKEKVYTKQLRWVNQSVIHINI